MAAANKPLKILACGDVAGKYDKLLKRIAVVNKKAGPFEMLLCVGRFLGTNGREDLRMLRARVYDFPVSTYVLAPVDDEELGPAGEEICPNLINLGSMGLYKTGSGLTIAYCGRVVNEAEVKAFVTNVSETDAVGVDVLLTCLWPENVMEFSSDPDKHNRLDTRLCSRVVSVAARSLRPRYHFAGMQRMYYERLPYRNHRVLVDAESHVTRFFGLADCGNAGEKWLYAFNVVPMRLMSRAELRAQPPDVTESPYRDDSRYSINELATGNRKEEKAMQYFYDFGPARGRGRGRGRGGRGGGGGFGGGSDQRNSDDGRPRRPDGDREDGPRSAPKQPRSSCWFCLSSPDVAKHLVITVGESVYLALAKGGLVPGHVIILPVEHFQALYAKEDLGPSLLEEVEKLRTALRRYFKSRGMACVFFERNYKSNHSQLHVVPIPAASESSCCEEILTRIQDSGVCAFKVLPKFADLKQIGGDGSMYLYVELPDGRRVFGRLPFPKRGVDDRHILTLMSAALADVLDVQERLDWRECVESVEEETAKRDEFAKSFAPFDPFNDDDGDDD